MKKVGFLFITHETFIQIFELFFSALGTCVILYIYMYICMEINNQLNIIIKILILTNLKIYLHFDKCSKKLVQNECHLCESFWSGTRLCDSNRRNV